MNLQQGTLLQGGKYRIERELGHGGFGVTYVAVQVGLNRHVAIKEFFMSEYCNRDADTSHVTVPSDGSRELVAKFRNKFVKEAQNIACLKHPHIISIHDVFEENGTAYYVMEYLDRGSLADVVKRQGALPVADALRYTRQIADALRYIHARKMNHLDVKPGNILVDEEGQAVLIDFGLSKRYDAEGNQTSTTPVGISHGYAPLEQYKKGGVGIFSPATDIYSLGATLYKLVTGATPPDADDIGEEGLPALPDHVPAATAKAIEQAMQFRRKDRPQTIEEFLALLDGTEITPREEVKEMRPKSGSRAKARVSAPTPKKATTSDDEETHVNPAHADSPASNTPDKPHPAERPRRNTRRYPLRSKNKLVSTALFIQRKARRFFVNHKALSIMFVCAAAVATLIGVRSCSNHRAEMARMAAVEQQRLDSIAKAEEAVRLALLEQQRKDSIAKAEAAAERARAEKMDGKLYYPSSPTPINIKERTIRDLLYFPYGCLPKEVNDLEKAKAALNANFGSWETINGAHHGLHRNSRFNYTYKGVPLGISWIDWYEDEGEYRSWYCFYFDTKNEADKFYDVIKEDLIKAGIPLTVDKIYGDHSNRTNPVSLFKWVYINSASKVKEAGPVHRANAVGKYYIELGVYKRKI